MPPELGVAKRLIARGNHVHVLADPITESAAVAAGCTFSPWRRAPHRVSFDPSEDLIKDWETKNPLVLLQRARDRLMAGPSADYAADTTDAINAFAPDAVVADSFLLGAVIAAQAASLPVALLVPNIWMMPTPGAPPIGPGFAPGKTALGRWRDRTMVTMTSRLFDKGVPAINAARSTNGLAPLRTLNDQALGANRILVLTSPAFDYASKAVPPNVHYVGPILDDPNWVQPWVSPWPDTDARPLVLVGFSTTFQNQGPLLRRVIEALSTLAVRAVVTVGQMLDPAELTSTDNVVVVGSAPHSQLLAHASLAISHCGHGTTIKTLAAGVPMVCIPMGRDQNDTAARVVYHGAGRRLPPRASVAKIRATVRRALKDDSLRANAHRLASSIADDRSTADVITELETLVP